LLNKKAVAAHEGAKKRIFLLLEIILQLPTILAFCRTIKQGKGLNQCIHRKQKNNLII
jgi:hypothetical protein